ncbi:hypothetical protein VTO42DRAFT_4447 [Malbranchea cinnamomea]
MLGIFAAFSGILSGLDQSVISGALPGIEKHFIAKGDWNDLDDPKLTHDISLISSLMPLVAMAGSLIMTPLNHYFGRRNSIIISCLWYTLGAGLCAGARSVHMLYAGRFILGVGVGIEGGCLMIAFGELIGYAAGGAFFGLKSGSWRWMLGSSLLFSNILFVGMFFLPECWLVSKVKQGIERAAGENWALIYASAMIFFGQMTGINAVMYNIKPDGENKSRRSFGRRVWVQNIVMFMIGLILVGAGMAICATFLYLWSFIVTYNFAGMHEATIYTGLTIGFFGGLAVVGFFYQSSFMPETKDKTLEEIDELFSMPTRRLVALNVSTLYKRWRWLFGGKGVNATTTTANIHVNWEKQSIT